MRTRNQSKRPQKESGSKNVKKDKHDSESKSPATIYHKSISSNMSRECVDASMKHAGSHKAFQTKQEEDDIPHGKSHDKTKSEFEDDGKQKVSAKPIHNVAVVGSTDANRKIVPEEHAQQVIQCSSPAKREDMDELDWEDGSISISEPRDDGSDILERGVTVEFSDSLPSAKRKVIKRASAVDKEFAELVHKAHLLCLLARGRLVDSVCNDPLIQASLLSLLPANLLNVASFPKLTAKALAPIVNWFNNNFRVRSPDMSERSFKSSLAYALESHEGTAEEVAALSVALFRALNLTTRYCTKWYLVASQRINSQWWDAVLAPLKELESRATGCVFPSEADLEIPSSEVKLMAVDVPGSLETQSSQATESLSMHENLPGILRLTEGFVGEANKVQTTNVGVQSSKQSYGVVANRSSLEDIELETRALTEPLPTNQLAYRNHHLYVIERWLTKYQILHPKGPILGYCSGHAVYPRTCVQTLQTKQRWLKEGLQVKANESPAKVVKRSEKFSKMPTTEPNCEEDDGQGTVLLYGRWQMEPLNLPHAVNGIVPKNERGQVDVWSEKCLPPGTIHLRLPRLVPVVKRLGIDFAPAMVGFEFRNGHSIPVFEGIVVCSEFRDAIMEAYAEEEERREAEEKKREESRAISRWYQLLSNIVTRQRLKNSYEDGSTSQTHRLINQMTDPCGTQIEGGIEPSSFQRGDVKDVQRDYKSMTFEVDHEHVFPIENQSFDDESSVRTKRCPCGFSVQVEEM